MKKHLLLIAFCSTTFIYSQAQNILSVTSATGGEETMGSLPNVVKNAANGDIIKFDVGDNSVVLTEELNIGKDLTIDGDLEGDKVQTIQVTTPGVSIYRLLSVGNKNTELTFTIKNCVLKGGDVTKGTAKVVAGPSGNITLTATWSATLYITERVNATIENITFDGGKGGYSPGLMNSGRSVLSNCIFQNMTATLNGGAIYTNNGGYLEIHDSKFENCQSLQSGGAIYVAESSIKIKNTQFINNKTTSIGNHYAGAIALAGKAGADLNAEIDGCIFKNNEAIMGTGNTGGAISRMINYKNFSLKNSTFINNQAVSTGGAVSTSGATEIEGCYFEGNQSKSNGGALYINTTATVNVKNSTFFKNSTKENVNAGGGAISALNLAATTFHNLTVVGNESEAFGAGINFGGGNELTSSPLTMNNCIFTLNKMTAPGAEPIIYDITTSSTFGILNGKNNIYGNFECKTPETQNLLTGSIIYTDQKLFATINGETGMPEPETAIEGTPKYFMIAKDGIAAEAGVTVDGTPTTDQRGINRNATTPSIGAIEVEKEVSHNESSSDINHSSIAYPIPAIDILYLKNTEAKEAFISNCMGQIVLHKSNPGESINISPLPAGIYTITIVGNSIETATIIIK